MERARAPATRRCRCSSSTRSSIQELFVFQLKFTQWKGYNLRASDAPKRRKRIEKSEVAAKRKEEAKALHEKKLEERNERLAEKRRKAAKKREAKKKAREAEEGGGDEDATGEGGAEASGGGSSGMQLVAVDADKSKKEKLSAEMRAENEALLSAAAAAGKKGAKKLTTAQKLRLQQAKAMAKEDERLSKIEAKKERLAKAEAAKRARRESRQKTYDPDVYEEMTSDPYVEFSIKPPLNPGCKILRQGGFFGRRVRTDYVPNTLNPAWEEAQKPLRTWGRAPSRERDPAHPRLRLGPDVGRRPDRLGRRAAAWAARLRQGRADLFFEEEDVGAPGAGGGRRGGGGGAAQGEHRV